METNIALRIFGAVLVLVGVVLVSNPELVSNKPIPENTFEAVERRIWWGLFIGVGVLLLFHHQLQPWLTTVAAVGSSLTFGLLVARLIGIALDGSVTKQWIWVAVEGIILAILVWWYAKAKR
ncbi:MAG: DUF4345 family protein [bacterium]